MRKWGKKSDEWLDWLNDEPPAKDVQDSLASRIAVKNAEPNPATPPAVIGGDNERLERLRRAGNYRSVTASTSTRAKSSEKAPKTGKPAVSINITMPKLPVDTFHKWRRRAAALPWGTVRFWGIRAGLPAVAVLTVGVIAVTLLTGDSTEKTDVQGTATVKTQPTFTPLAPQDKPQLGKTESAATVYDGKRNLLSYRDNFSGTNLVVAQQPLAEVLTKDPAKVLQLTDSIGAKDKVTTAYGVAYYGYDEKAKITRSVLLNTTKKLLIFIQADRSLDAETLKFYIESLR